MRPGTAPSISLLLTLLLASAAQALAQGDAVPRAGVSARAEVRHVSPHEVQLRARARDLASSTADEALKWDDKTAAVRALSQAADLLWSDQPGRSRGWLVRAWELTAALADEGSAEAEAERFRTNSPQTQARAAVLAVAQKHDRPLAERLLEQLGGEQEKSRHNTRRGVFDDRSARSRQLLSLALTVAESDPPAAAALAERSLADGISFQLQGVLLALRRRERSAADRLFDASLARLATGFAHPSEGQVLASYLFTPGRVVGPGGGGTMALAVSAAAPAPPSTPAEEDPTRARRFLSVMQRVMLSMPAPSTTANPSQTALEFVTLSGSLAQAYRAYAPELWLPIEQRVALVTPDLAPAPADTSLNASMRERLRSGAAAGADDAELERLYAEGLEEAAEKETDPVARKLAFVRAALATAPEDLERGRRLAARIGETELRSQVVSHLVYRAALAALDQGRFEEAVALAAEAAPTQRAVILITAAQRATAARPGEDSEQTFRRRARALELLTEAERVLERVVPPGASVRLRLGLAVALAPLDPTRALAAFGEAVTAVNKDASFDAADNSAPRVASLAEASASTLPPIRVGYGLKDAAAALARVDFEGTVAHASRLAAPPVRGASLLEIARTILLQAREK